MMDCLHSMAPNDEDLLNYALDDEPLPEQQENHLEQCEICQQRLSRYKQIHTSLVSHLYRSQCPTATQLSFYCAGMLPENQRMHIAAHLRECPLCMQEVTELRRLLKDFDPFPPLPHSPTITIRRFVATLVKQQAQLVLRRDEEEMETLWPRQYHAEPIDISLHLSRTSAGEHLLVGIITSTDPAISIDAFEGVKAELYPASYESGNHVTPLLATQVDDLGNLIFSGVPVGEYTLVIHLAVGDVVINRLSIAYA